MVSMEELAGGGFILRQAARFWPDLAGLDLAAEDIDIRVVLGRIGLSESRIDNAIRALEEFSAGSDSPSTFRPQHVEMFARACDLKVKGPGGSLDLESRRESLRLESLHKGAALVSLLLALVGRGAGALSTFTSVDMARTPDAGLITLYGYSIILSLCANLVDKSSKVRFLLLEGQTNFKSSRRCKLLSQALRSNRCLKELYLPNTDLDSRGVKLLVSALKENHTLELLDIGYNGRIGDEGAGYVAELLEHNTSLKVLQMRGSGMRKEGARYMSAALARNSTLRDLSVGDCLEAITALLQVLTPGSSNEDGNTSLASIELVYTDSSSVESIASMIKRNTSLTRLRLKNADLRPDQWLRSIIPALRENATLKELDVRGSEGVSAKDVFVESNDGSSGVMATGGVFKALIDLVKSSNTALEVINVDDTPLSRAGMAGRLAEELRISKEYRSKFMGQPTRTPVCGRLVLCGYEFSGKTTICKTMRCIMYGKPNFHAGRMAFKNFLREYPGLRQFLYGEQASKELEDRTRGFQVVVLRKDPDRRTTLWDFAGQKEYYVLHDFMLPNARNTCFLFVCSAVYPAYYDPQPLAGKPKSQQEMENEFFYWLRFLASNADPSSTPPRVMFVLTNKDVLGANSELAESMGWANSVVADMKEKFHNVIHFVEDRAVVVNAQSLGDVKRLLEKAEGCLKELLAGGLQEYKVCEDVRLALEEWAASNPSKPIIRMEEFQSLCHQQVRRAMDGLLVGEDGRHPVLAYLNDVGDIIFPGKVDFIVVNPTWFGRGVLGSLIDAFRRTREGSKSKGLIGYFKDWLPGANDVLPGLNHRHGFVSYSDLEQLLETSLQTMHLKGIITPKDLIALMIELEMCFEEKPEENRSRLFIPALFDDADESAAMGKRKAEWKLGRKDGPFQHVGRRLQCASTALTFLSPGFFPRLQVVLRNYYYSKQWTANPAFQVDRNLIGFAHNGHEIIVEYSGDIDCFVDILAMSSQTYKRTLDFVEEHVTKKIREFCASPQGCQGVVLVDAVIRPICVEQLHMCADRIDEAVLVSTLEDNLAEDPDEKACIHTWQRQIQGIEIVDYALDLLEGKNSYRKFKDTRTGVQVPDRGSPRNIFVTKEDVQWTNKMLAKVRYGRVVPFRLHLRCECRDREHAVDGQLGRTFYVVDKDFAKEERIRLGLGKAAAAALKGGNSFVPGLAAVASLPLYDGTPVYCDTIESLSASITQFGRAGGTVSDEELRVQVEKDMQSSRAGFWMTAFLNFVPNFKESQEFREDFLLREVEYHASASTNTRAWVCERHCKQGEEDGILVRRI